MPKEVIRDAFDGNDYRIIENDGSETLQTFVGNFLQVGWDRNAGHVQAGVLQGGDHDESKKPGRGLYVQLDRPGINRLIRLLRKARDAAYGADA